MDKLREAVKDIAALAEIGDCEDFSVNVNEEEKNWTIEVDYWSDEWNYLLNIKQVSKMLQRLLQKARIKRER